MILTAGAISAPAVQVKSLTWNIHGVITESSWNSSSAQALARVINYYLPDVVTFDECSAGSSDVSRTNLTNNLTSWATTYLTNWPSRYVYVSTLGDGFNRDVILSRYPMDSFTDQSCAPRGLMGAIVRVPGTNGVKVYTTHLKAYGDASSAQEKQNGANTVYSDVSAWSLALGNADVPYIIQGDMNEDEENPEAPITGTYHPITTMLQSYVSDYKPNDLHGNAKTWSSSSPASRLDHMMPSWLLKANWTNSSPMWSMLINTSVLFSWGQLPAGVQKSDSQASDHLPIIGTFDILDNTLSSVRATANGGYTAAAKKYVAASFADHYYIEEPGGTAGVRVNGTTGNPSVGSIVNVCGTLVSSSTAEEALTSPQVRVLTTVGGTITPQFTNIAGINGESYNGINVDGYTAPFNGGLLVTTAGRVTSTQAGFFYMTDGSGFPVRVAATKSISTSNYAKVTGVIGFRVADSGDKPERFLEARSDSDVQVYNLGSIASARVAKNGDVLALSAQTVTASFSDHLYLEDADRLHGIRVNWAGSPAPSVGSVVDVIGSASISANAEDAITATDVINSGANSPIAPLAMCNRDINGESYSGVAVDGFRGPSNAALLVKTWGSVESPDASGFYVNDGSGYRVRVQSTRAVTAGDFVAVTGVIGYSVVGGTPQRMLETRSTSDVQVYAGS